MPKVLQLHLSWAATDEEAMDNAIDRVAQRRHEVPQGRHPLAARLRSRWPSSCGRRTSRAGWSSSSDPDEHRAEIQRFVDLGFDRVYLHNVGRNQAEWIEVFGRDVLPKLHR